MTATTERWFVAVGLDELPDARPVGDHDVVGQDDRERLVADQLLGHQHRVAQAELLLLADVADLDHVADLAHAAEHLDVALLLEQVLELVGVVEVILDRALLAAGDDDHLLDAGRDRFLDGVLDDRLVDQRQHLLGLRLGRGQEAGAPTGGREDCLSDAQAGPQKRSAKRAPGRAVAAHGAAPSIAAAALPPTFRPAGRRHLGRHVACA